MSPPLISTTLIPNASSTPPTPHLTGSSRARYATAPTHPLTPSSPMMPILPTARAATAVAITSTPKTDLPLPPQTKDESLSTLVGGSFLLPGSIPAKLYQLSRTSTLLPGAGVKEIVVLERSVRIVELVPATAGTPLEGIVVSDGRLVYQGANAEAGEEAGVWMSGIVGMRQVPGLGVFGLQEGSVDVRGFCGRTRNWKKPLEPKEMELRGLWLGGLEDGIQGNAVVFTRLGVSMKVVRTVDTGYIHRRKEYEAAVELFGDVIVDPPGSALPLSLEWTMREEEPELWVLRIGKAEERVIDIVGFKGLKLSRFQLVAKFPGGKARTGDWSFDISAKLAFGKGGAGELFLTGAYSDVDFYLASEIPECTINDIIEFFTAMTGHQLEPFERQVDLKNVRFKIDSTGLFFTADVTIDGHRSADCTIKIHRDGVHISGSMTDMQFGAVAVHEALLEVFLGRTDPSDTCRDSGFQILGRVTFHEVNVNVAVYTSVSEGGDVHWTVYGELTGSILQLNRFAPDVKGTWLDLELREIAFIASNIDAPQGSEAYADYPVQKGIMFCAEIDRLQPLDHVTKSEVDGLVLRARWSEDQGFNFEAVLPTPVGIQLTKSITSGPVTVGIVPGFMPEIVFTASLNVTPPKHHEPLVFNFGLKASLDSASGFGEMKNYWHNPLGISEQVKIGPDLGIEIGVIYAVLLSTGTPSSIKFKGGMAIGDVEAQCAMAISENPADELIKAKLNELTITDLVKFASSCCGEEIPLPPEDVMAFRDIDIYMSSGVSIGTTYYPAGASMRGEITLFGKTARLECTVGAVTRLAASFDALQVGPLEVTGTVEGTGPSAEIELGLKRQHILVDGRVKIFDFEASLHAVFDILPVPNMEFDLRLGITDVLNMSLSAKIVGMADFTSLKDADFMIHASLEPDILDFFIRQIRKFLEVAMKVINFGLEAAQEFVQEVEETVSMAVTAAEEAFQSAQAALEEKEKEIGRELGEIADEFEAGVETLKEEIFGFKQEADDVATFAHHELQQARIRSAAAVQRTELQLHRERKLLTDDINSQLDDVRAVKEEAKAKFGNVTTLAKDAEAQVAEAQKLYNSAKRAYEVACEKRCRTRFGCGLCASLNLSHLRLAYDRAATDLAAATDLHTAALTRAADEELQTLLLMKDEKKAALLDLKESADARLAELTTNLEAMKAVEAEVSNQTLETEVVAPVLDKLKEAEDKLAGFKAEKLPLLEEAKAKVADVAALPEFEVLEKAKAELLSVVTETIDTDAVRLVIDRAQSVGELVPKPLEEMESPEDVFDLESIELRGSLRDLVKRGVPLEATVVVVLMGKTRTLRMGYGLTDVRDLVMGVFESAWEEIKDWADGDDEKE